MLERAGKLNPQTNNAAAIIVPNKCRVCGCTEERACLFPQDDGGMTACWWVDQAHTLCSNPGCIAGIPLDKLLLIADFDVHVIG